MKITVQNIKRLSLMSMFPLYKCKPLRNRHAELGSVSHHLIKNNFYDKTLIKKMLNQVQHDGNMYKAKNQSAVNNLLKYSYLILLVAALLFPNRVQSQYELNQYLITAAQNNPGLKAKFSAYMAGMEKVPQVGGLPDLKFAFGYFIQPIETRVGPQRAKLSIAQTFPWFGLLGSREDVAIQQASVLYEAFEESKSRLYYEIKSAYFELYFIEKSIDISLENIEILNKLLQLTITKIESGSSSIVDDYRVEMELNDIENQLALLRDSQQEYHIKFNRLLNVPDDSFVSIPDSLWQSDLFYSRDALLDSIEANNHEVKQIAHRITAWEKKETAAHKAYSPNIFLGFDYTFVDKYDNPVLSESENGKDAMFARVGISIPLYGKKYNGLIRESTLQIEKEGFAKEDKINRLNIIFEGAYKNYNDGVRRLKLFQRQYELANRSLNILMENYATDGRNFVEVLRIQRKMLTYDLNLDKARADVNAAVAFVDYLSGK
jgi:cobalt-zinc-cadmium efflux system outer membrane protein